MGTLIKKQVTRYTLAGKHVAKGTLGAVKSVETTLKWYGQYTDEHGTRRTKSLSKDKKAAAAMLAQIEADVERRILGVIDTFTDNAQKPLHWHLEDYLAIIANNGATELHVDSERARIERICKSCKFSDIRHLDAAKLDRWLAKRRKDNNFGVVTRNHHLRAIKSFARWLVDNHRAKTNPFTCLRPLNTEVEESRHARRVLSDDDFARLLNTTRHSMRVDGRRSPDWSFDGEQRYHLYLTAAYTGLRASELASLSVSSFDFESGLLVVRAGYSKHRQEDRLPLLADLGDVLQEWLKVRQSSPADPLWPGRWAELRRGGKILRRDLKEASIPYRCQMGEVYDFHCLRGQFATMLVRSEVHPKKAQALMRHSDINLTMNIYAKLRIDELAPELSKLKLPKE